MFFYGLYLLGLLGAWLFPRRCAYWIAHRGADFCYLRSAQDREAVRENLKSIFPDREISPSMVREVFRNFGMYLVDFFRFGRLTSDQLRKLVRLEGIEHMEAALKEGKGVVGLTAHLGNFELAGAVLALLGLPVNAVVLTHQNPRVNRFFLGQRERVGVKGIALDHSNWRGSYGDCVVALRRNEILALVGDRDFFDHGLAMPFFGKELKVPTGPAAFSVRTGAPIVPGFLVREKDDTYRFILERPISIPEGLPREEMERKLLEQCLDHMARYIRQYPTQWYMFQKFWSPGPANIL